MAGAEEHLTLQATEAVADNEVEGQAGAKRKRDDAQQTQQRSKRNRYISIACNECKRRKIKCNGEIPCQRCGNLNLECLYAPNCCSNTFKDSIQYKEMSAQIASLQEQVESLHRNLSNLRATLGHDLPFDHAFQSLSDDHLPSVAIDPALNREKGYEQQEHLENVESDEAGLRSSAATGPSDSSNFRLHESLEPMRCLPKEEALRLFRLYEEEVGLMYPVLDFEKSFQFAKFVFVMGEALGKNKSSVMVPTGTSEPDRSFDVTKLVLAIALVIENSGHSELGQRFFDTTASTIEGTWQGESNLEGIQALCLRAMYHFHCGDEALAWRVIGMAARMCLEMGLHKSETYASLFPSEDGRNLAAKVFWSVYTLDRRWSFGTGMSFALQEADIDPNVPRPVDSPYLSSMIPYAQLCTKVWRSISPASSSRGREPAFSKDEINYLDFQAQQWYQNVPEYFRYRNPSAAADNDALNGQDGRAMHRLRLILYLRANQIRILIHRPVLQSASLLFNSSSTSNLNESALTVVNLAKDTIRVLSHVNSTSDMYRSQQMCFNYFLVSALVVFFLAVSHAPNQFTSVVREEFYMALVLVKNMSRHSYTARRLWKTIKSLRDMGAKLGVLDKDRHDGNGDVAAQGARNKRDDSALAPGSIDSMALPSAPQRSPSFGDAHSSAAMAMARLRAGKNNQSSTPGATSLYTTNDGNMFGSSNMPVTTNADFATNTSGIATAGVDMNSRIMPLMQTQTIAPVSPENMANELTMLFEAAGGFTSAMNGNHFDDTTSSSTARSGSMSGRGNFQQGPTSIDAETSNGGNPTQGMNGNGNIPMSGGLPWINEDDLNHILGALA